MLCENTWASGIEIKQKQHPGWAMRKDNGLDFFFFLFKVVFSAVFPINAGNSIVTSNV